MSMSRAHLESVDTIAQRHNGKNGNGYGAVSGRDGGGESQDQDESDGEQVIEDLEDRPVTPLPRMQIAILFIMRMSERECSSRSC